MPTAEFLPLDPSAIDVKSFDCGKDVINAYLRRYAARNMALNLNRTFVLLYVPDESTGKSHAAAYYTLAHQTLVREELPDPSRLPRYPVPVVLLAQLGVDRRFQGQGLGTKTLVWALRHAHRIASDPDGIPAMGVVLDVLDQDALSFYQSFEFFLPLTNNPMRLFVPMASLEAL
ncbi:MAG: GNAT family N-acetyltransferase [Gammaproteobacteria bacterium]|nr:GNAT family N-acetyltransferase [Gammaproteobacteria bacterium]